MVQHSQRIALSQSRKEETVFHKRWVFVWIGFGLAVGKAPAAAPPSAQAYLMPTTCSELMPEPGPFLDFFRSVAQGQVKDRVLAKRLLKILYHRDQTAKKGMEPNPIDVLVGKFCCYYRKREAPVRPVAFDDSEFLAYLRKNLPELELKVSDAIFNVEYISQKRHALEQTLENNRQALDVLALEAEQEAKKSYDKIAGSAKAKVRIQ